MKHQHKILFIQWNKTRQIIIYFGIIMTGPIQIQSISLIYILLHKPSEYRIIVPHTKTILLCLLVILLACVVDSVRQCFYCFRSYAKDII